jgi:YebC/PmpR family DNA-binding regulatory protein
MSGHSKWSQIKRQKGASDARRGQLFTKLTREIIVAARQGGPNPESNFRLRLAIQKARDSNMPLDNIDRAVKKGSGASESGSLTELTLEGYGHNGVAVMVEAVTDNRNRTIADVRSVFTKHGGNLGESGCVSWLFESRGVIIVDTKGADADELALFAIDAGADDVKIEKDYLEVLSSPQKLEIVRKNLERKGTIISAEVSLVPKSTVMVDEQGAIKVLKLIDHLDELDDVQRVFSNVDYSESVMEKLKAQV